MLPTVLDHQPITAREEDRPALIKLEDLFDHLEPESTTFQLVNTSGTAAARSIYQSSQHPQRPTRHIQRKQPCH